MVTQYWTATAPSNIALIKYMGKDCYKTNLPANPSFSYTLNNLNSTVQLSLHTCDEWQPLSDDLTLSEKAQQRFLNFLTLLKNKFNMQENFLVESKNNFPCGTGIASSASSFAALAKVANQAFSQHLNIPPIANDELASIARMGSGSAIRSFYEPWALWEKEEAHGITLPYTELLHQVILIDEQPKKISSSDAHRLIQSSPIYTKRLKDLPKRLDDLLTALNVQDWGKSYEIIQTEFLEMHALFETASQPFYYMNAQSKTIIDEINQLWKTQKDGPLITMDAGPNIHLLYRPDQTQLAEKLKQYYQGFFNVL